MSASEVEENLEGWAELTLPQQLVRIAYAADAAHNLSRERTGKYSAQHNRVLRMVDLTLEAQFNPSLRRELELWREYFADYYRGNPNPPDSHRTVLRCLLQLNPESARQIQFLCP